MDGEAAFTRAVEDGLRLAKRVCYSGVRGAPPARPAGMQRSPPSLLPTAPMLYAVIGDPGIVDNPDLPSYQPHVHGRMDPPALIPLQLNGMGMEIDCVLDTAVVTMTGTWRVHCVMTSRSCECRLVVPMGEQGSILGAEVDVSKQSFSTQVIQVEGNELNSKMAKDDSEGYLRPQMFSLTVPQVPGGSNVSIKVTWCQKLLYKEGRFSVAIPYSFPEFSNPLGKSTAKREKIKLNVRTATSKEVICETTSHALKEVRRELGSLFFSYETDVLCWSTVDFNFSYTVYSSELFGGIILQSPSLDDLDQREMFYLYLFPGNGSNQQKKVFKNKVVFLIDKSDSMKGRTLEHVKNALLAAISELAPDDSFNIIAFNDETHTFSSSLEPASSGNIEKVTQWINKVYVAGGGTNIMQPLVDALGMLSDAEDSVPHIYLITDGSVEDERNICNNMKRQVINQGSVAPRISTFGLGSYCNHYFLRMLATIGRGQYDAAFDADSIEQRLQSFLQRTFSPVFVDIAIDAFEKVDGLEVYPYPIPDLLLDRPLIISGRYLGNFPDAVKATGIWADMSNFMVDLDVKRLKDIPIDRVSVKQQIDLMTAHAWLADSIELQEKVIKLSKQRGLPSEYTYLIMTENINGNIDAGKEMKKSKMKKRQPSTKEGQAKLVAHSLGFGDVNATMHNLPTCFEQAKPSEPGLVLKRAAGCCNCLCECLCCRCCISVCSKMNDHCAIVIAQLLTALGCLACFECCSQLCGNSE